MPKVNNIRRTTSTALPISVTVPQLVEPSFQKIHIYVFLALSRHAAMGMDGFLRISKTIIGYLLLILGIACFIEEAFVPHNLFKLCNGRQWTFHGHHSPLVYDE